jgi:hypothetical protein
MRRSPVLFHEFFDNEGADSVPNAAYFDTDRGRSNEPGVERSDTPG